MDISFITIILSTQQVSVPEWERSIHLSTLYFVEWSEKANKYVISSFIVHQLLSLWFSSNSGLDTSELLNNQEDVFP